MWKKQWNKLKTALGTPEDYVSEEEQEAILQKRLSLTRNNQRFVRIP